MLDAAGMGGVRDFRDLIAWQLADELRQEIIALTATPPASRDFKFCNQIRDAISSACRNTAEGYGRFRPADNVRFLEYAHGSLSEVQDGLIEAREKKYVDDHHFNRVWTLSRRAIGANTNYQEYLRRLIRTGDKPWLRGKSNESPDLNSENQEPGNREPGNREPGDREPGDREPGDREPGN